MPKFTILATDGSYTLAALEAPSASQLLHVIEQLSCNAVDVLEKGAYKYSLRLNTVGRWIIFQRDHANGWEGVESLG